MTAPPPPTGFSPALWVTVALGVGGAVAAGVVAANGAWGVLLAVPALAPLVGTLLVLRTRAARGRATGRAEAVGLFLGSSGVVGLILLTWSVAAGVAALCAVWWLMAFGVDDGSTLFAVVLLGVPVLGGTVVTGAIFRPVVRRRFARDTAADPDGEAAELTDFHEDRP